MKNKLTDLNNHLFAELERLGDEDLQDEALDKEIERAKAITGVSSQVVQNATLMFNAEKLRCEYGGWREDIKMPEVLGLDEGKEDA